MEKEEKPISAADPVTEEVIEENSVEDISEVEEMRNAEPYEEAPIVAKSTKVLRRAVTKINELKIAVKESKVNKEALVTAVKKTVSQVISLKEEVAKIKIESEAKINLYKENAQLIISRQSELGEEYSSELSDSDLLNDDKFERAKLLKENDLIKSSKDNKEDDMIIGEKPEARTSELNAQAKEIDAKAFGAKKRNA